MDRNDEYLISPTDPAASAFADAARAYCEFIDAAVKQRPDPFYGPLQDFLIRLVELVEALPGYLGSVVDQKTQARFDAEHTRDHAAISRGVHELTADDAKRLEERESHDSDGTTRCFMLYDDLADIHHDLSEGLRWWDQKTDMACSEAVWVWRFDYEQHWGEHLHRALQTIHGMRFRLRLT